MPNASGEVECSQNKCCGMPAVGKNVAKNLIAVVLAGAAAETMLHGEYYAGCCYDFKGATELAWKYVTECGMSKKIGLTYLRSTHMEWNDGYRKYSVGPATLDDTFNEVKHLLDECFNIPLAVLKQRRGELEKVAKLLTEKELVTLDMLVDVLGPSPHIDLEKLTLEDVDFLPAGMKSWQTSE